MKDKVKRILELVRAGKLSLEDATPLLASLNVNLALSSSDRELIGSLLSREDLGAEQVAEHLLLLRSVKDREAVPSPPKPPQPPRPPRVVVPGLTGTGPNLGQLHGLGDRLGAKIEQLAQQFAARAEAWGESVEQQAEHFAQVVEGAVDSAVDSRPAATAPGGRLIKISVESAEEGDYQGNIPISLAPHLQKLIPPHGLRALAQAGFSLEGLQLLLEANPPPGPLISFEDHEGNSVQIVVK